MHCRVQPSTVRTCGHEGLHLEPKHFCEANLEFDIRKADQQSSSSREPFSGSTQGVITPHVRVSLGEYGGIGELFVTERIPIEGTWKSPTRVTNIPLHSVRCAP